MADSMKIAKEKDIAEGKRILQEQLKGKTLTITRRWTKNGEDGGKGRRTTRIPPLERADMMRTILEQPDITGKEFAKEYGYSIDRRGSPSNAVYDVINVLKEEIQGYKMPEMQEILQADLLIVALGAKEVLRRLKSDEDVENMSASEVALLVDKSFKRSRLLQGKSTSNVAVNVDVSEMNEKDLDSFLNDAIRVKVEKPEE